MVRKAKRDYKTEKIPVSCSLEYKLRVEKKAEALGISPRPCLDYYSIIMKIMGSQRRNYSMQELPFKPQIFFCKRCLARYSLGIPYDRANSPARDLCDNCIVDLNIDEFNALDFSKPRENIPLETKEAGLTLGDLVS